MEMLARHGLTLWWDREIPLGKSFDQIIEEALEAARCVVVVWSKQSIKSKWVRAKREKQNADKS